MVSEQNQLPIPQKINLKAMSPTEHRWLKRRYRAVRGEEGVLFSTE